MEELEKNETSTQAEENTVSLASAQALADALAKIEAYTPTTWVDNSSPDIDAEHLNKPEQAIKRVTDALNSAVDVIKDLQSQVTKNAGDISTVNNNLSKKADSTSLSNYALKSDLENITPIFHDTVGTDKKELLRNKLSVLKGKKNGMYMIYGGWSTKMFGMTIGQVVGSSYMVMFITSTYIMISETNDFTTYGYRQVALTDF